MQYKSLCKIISNFQTIPIGKILTLDYITNSCNDNIAFIHFIETDAVITLEVLNNFFEKI